MLIILTFMFHLLYVDRGSFFLLSERNIVLSGTISSNSVNGEGRSKENPEGSGFMVAFWRLLDESFWLGSFWFIQIRRWRDQFIVHRWYPHWFSHFLSSCSILQPTSFDWRWIHNLGHCSSGKRIVSRFLHDGVFSTVYWIWRSRHSVYWTRFYWSELTFLLSAFRRVLDDKAPAGKVTLWLSILYMSIPNGFALGVVYAEVIETFFGWRAVLLIEAALAVPFIMFCFFAAAIPINRSTDDVSYRQSMLLFCLK